MTPERIEELKEESRYAKNHSGTITLSVAEFDELLEASCFKPEATTEPASIFSGPEVTGPGPVSLPGATLPSFEPIGIGPAPEAPEQPTGEADPA